MDEQIMAPTFELLHGLGITANYGGYYYTAYAVLLAQQQPDRLLLVTKWLYPDIARQYKTTWQCVERNIRTVISLAWQRNQTLLEDLMGRPLVKRPNVGQFIAMLAYRLSDPRAA